MNSKKPWASKTLWGGFIMLAAVFMNSTGVTSGMMPADMQAEAVDEIVSTIDAVTAFTGWVLVMWGRITAEKKITLTRGG